MLKEQYVIGACINAFANRYPIHKRNIPADLIIMCDKMIYDNWGDVLKKFYDKVIKIKLKHFDMTESYKYAKNKYDWLSYSINKWQIMNYDEYDKILFCDVGSIRLILIKL